MRMYDLRKTIDVFDGNADGSAFQVKLHLRSGGVIVGDVHPYNNEGVLWIDTLAADGSARPVSVSVEAIEAIQYIPEAEMGRQAIGRFA